MTYTNAIIQMKNGNKLARIGWDNAYIFIGTYAGFKNQIIGHQDLGGHFTDVPEVSEMGNFPFSPIQEDVNANDWYVVKING